ncbi:hypothetical protein GGI12_005887, partial [Dipsacomyces acuminosporus]
MKFVAFCISVAATVSAIASPELNKRIIGGVDLPDNGAPFTVRIYIKSKGGVYACGGSVLSKTHIITAGHCLVDEKQVPYPANHVIVGHGSDNLNHQTLMNATNVIVHPQYTVRKDGHPTKNDIAIIGVPEMKLDKNTAAISVYNGNIYPGARVFALGWGATVANNNPNSMPSELKGAFLHIGTTKGCKVFDPEYESADGPRLCTLNKYTPGTSTCKGDSGTGVVVEAQNGYYLAGLDSQGGRFHDAICGTADGYTLFTR